MSESTNKFLLPLREGHISYGLIIFIEQEQNRILTNKNRALRSFASGKKLVPKMEIKLQKTDSDRIKRSRDVRIVGNGIVKVYSHKTGSLFYQS